MVEGMSHKCVAITSEVDSQQEFYLKGIYPVEVVSELKDGYVEVRVKNPFLHTSAYSDGKRQVRVGVTEKRWVKPGEVLRVSFRLVWSHRRLVAKGHAPAKEASKTKRLLARG
jgi:hypothetical protein